MISENDEKILRDVLLYLENADSGLVLIEVNEPYRQNEITGYIHGHTPKKSLIIDLKGLSPDTTHLDEVKTRVGAFPEAEVIMILNLHTLAATAKDKELRLVRDLNFSREPYAKMNKLLIFFFPAYFINIILSTARDFYGFISINFRFPPEQTGLVSRMNQEREMFDEKFLRNRAAFFVSSLQSSDISDSERADMLYDLAQVYQELNLFDDALAYYKTCLDFSIRLDRKPLLAKIYKQIGWIHLLNGEYEQALELFQQGLTVCRDIRDRKGEARALDCIGHYYYYRGNPVVALNYFEQCLKISRAIKDKEGEAITLNDIGQMHKEAGSYAKARVYFEKSLIISRTLKDKRGEGTALNNIGEVHFAEGEDDEALKYFEEALEIYKKLGDRQGEITAQQNIGYLYSGKGDSEKSLNYLEQGDEDMKGKKEFTVFIASPGDVMAERELVRQVCEELGKDVFIRDYGVLLHAEGWEDVIPAAGRPQEIINTVLDRCDLFICIFHKRFGSPSGKAKSGTLEEFLKAYNRWKDLKKPHIMLYFKEVKISSIKDLDDQLNMVLKFRDKVEKNRSLLFGQFSAPEEFKEMLSIHLKKWIVERVRKAEKLGAKHAAVCKRDKPSIRSLKIPEAYHRWLSSQCAHMNIDNLREKGKVIQVNLPEIFIPLYSNPIVKEKKQESSEDAMRERERLVDIEDLIAGNEYLLIEGDPGSGKTTLMKHVAYTINRKENLQGLNDYLPVLVFFRDLHDFLIKQYRPRPNGAFAEQLLEEYFKAMENGLDIETVRAYCEAGRTIFLLDGLDEMSQPARDAVVKSFAALRSKYSCVKVVLSGRTHGIEGAVIECFGDRHAKIQPLNMDQVGEFIRKWFYYIYAGESKIGSRTASDMIGEIQDHPGVGRLIETPLMLTAICILYHDGRELPGQRAELYKKFINNLLSRRFDETEKVHNFLKALALKMHKEKTAGIDRLEALKVLGSEYRQKEGESDRDYGSRLEKEFDRIEPDCGLLKSERGQYQFRHLTFQEFLAATGFVDSETDYVEKLKGYWEDGWYSEMIELCIGYLSIDSGKWANKIVGDALERKDEPPFFRWRIAAKGLLDIHRDRRSDELLVSARKRLKLIIGSNMAPKELADAGETLGWLGDDRPLDEFIKVKGGKYPIGKNTVEIAPFELGRYPVTNKWFAEFVGNKKDGRYSNPAFWSEEGLKWLAKADVKQPRYWDERRWKCPNSPVVGVCWYEAEAFTKWLSLTRNDGYVYRLPEGNEWEAAAAGKDGREYPWGPWKVNRCNTYETGIMKTSPVGIFGKGETPEKIADMAGNVWEWTSSDYDNESKVLRGGSWDDDQGLARCAFRFWNNPDFRYYGLGFRCARTPK